MAKVSTKAKKAAPTPPGETYMQPHELVLSPTIQSAAGIHAWGKFLGEIDLGELIKEQRERVKKVQGGDMQPVEAMLYGQAMTLETIFTSLARRAASQEYLKQFQTYLGLALKAQAQCRATLEALAEIKNPKPVLIAKQANISGGHQQVNNGVAADPTHAKQNEGVQNGLLEASHGVELDTRAQSAAGRADPAMATLG